MTHPSSSTELSRRQWLGAVSLPAAALLATSVASAETPSAPPTGDARTAADRGARVYNVRDFGAKGDGTTLDTAAVQAAIDACAQDQGGTVLVPAGVFMIATIELKSNVTLHLAAQAKLLGTADGKLYKPASAVPLKGEHTMGDGNVAIIFAANAENVTLEGEGTIDGQGAQFHAAKRGDLPPAGVSGAHRPHHCVFYRCTNLTIRGVFLQASAFQSIRVCVCNRVKIDGIRIYSRVNSNNDGLHFISSQFVHVSNCDVQCQDDACALFGSCKFITITNCTFSTRWSVFRFGTGEAENITVSNCIISGTWGCPIKMRCDSQSRFENISFSDLVLNEVTGPISIGLGPQHPSASAAAEKPGIARNISFRGIRATVAKPRPLPETTIGSNFNPGEVFSCIILNGMNDGVIENVSFDDVQVIFPGGGTAEHAAVRDVPKIAAEYYAIGVPPAHGLYARNVRGLTLHNVRFSLAAPDLRPAVILDQVEDVAANGLDVAGQADAESALRIISSRDVFLSAPRVRSAAAVFLQVEGAGNEHIVVSGGDLAKAARAVAAKNGGDEHAVDVRA